MTNPVVSNPNDFKVVDFTNKTSFDFTHEMGCMFDSRPLFGISAGTNGIKAGESVKLPYHVGHRLATNLAKAVMTRQAPTTDQAGIPTGVPLWDDAKLEALKSTFIAELYTEARPIAETEVDRLMKKVAELNKLVMDNIKAPAATIAPATAGTPKAEDGGNVPVYQDKSEVIAELSRRQISHDPRSSKEELQKLLS